MCPHPRRPCGSRTLGACSGPRNTLPEVSPHHPARSQLGTSSFADALSDSRILFLPSSQVGRTSDFTQGAMMLVRPPVPPSRNIHQRSTELPLPHSLSPVPSLGGVFLIMAPRIYRTLPLPQPQPGDLCIY